MLTKEQTPTIVTPGPALTVATDEAAIREIVEVNDRHPNLVFAIFDKALTLGTPYRLEERDIAGFADAAELAVPGGIAALRDRIAVDEQGRSRNYDVDERAAADSFGTEAIA